MTHIVMSGTHIIGTLLRAHAPLITAVPAGSLKRGRLPDAIALPALVVVEISHREGVFLDRPSALPMHDRVAVTGRFATDREREQIMQMVVDACAGKFGRLAGASWASVAPAGRGPDLNGPGNSFEKTQDFLVSYSS